MNAHLLDTNNSDVDHAESAGRSLRLLGRALRLRCPNCGHGPVLRSWLALREHCGTCDLRLERGEHDYFMGSLLLNYSLTGVFLVLSIYVVLWWKSPEVPWTLLQWGGAAAVVALPLALFPFSKLLWLAADLIFRPERRTTT